MKKIFSIIVFVIIWFITIQTYSQINKTSVDTVFQLDEVSRVDITIHPDSLAEILNPENSDSYHEFPATFKFTNSLTQETIENIGFRLRGNTSRHSAKKSFKVSFNSFESKKFHGLEKMNLNGEHNDPSIIRSRISWDLFKLIDLPASRSSYTELYINEEYKGLYINVEHVDEEFVYKQFENKSGNLYKCLWPADLNYISDNPEDYKYTAGDRRAYELKTNDEIDDYSDLAEFIDILNNTSDENFQLEFEEVCNVSSVIKYLVIEVLTGHWDAYSVNKNNFYLYHNSQTGKFEFIPYDMDNTFGIDWFGIDWGIRDIYNWSHDSENRPLYQRIMQNEVYKDQFSYYMNLIIQNYFNEDYLYSKVDDIKTMIDPYVVTDEYHSYDYGWDFDDYTLSYTEALGNHVTYGLKQYIIMRKITANSQLEINNIRPVYLNLWHEFSSNKDSLYVYAKIDDEANLTLTLDVSINDTETITEIFNQSDLANNIYKCGIKLNLENGILNYYVIAEDEIGQAVRNPLEGTYQIYFNQPSADLVINEFMASNSATIADNYGGFPDWLEIYNAGDESVFLGNFYLTDDQYDPDKWRMPSVNIQPSDFLIIWADDDTEQGYNHSNFKLSKSGEDIGIYEYDGTGHIVVDLISYGEQQTDISSGNSADGNGIITLLDNISPNYSNTDDTHATVTLNVNMSYQSKLGNFDTSHDFMDVAGTFYDWSGSGELYDPNGDFIYAHTLFNVPVGGIIEYKFRINADWGTSEFPDHGPNREFNVPSGFSFLEHWYNDEIDPDISVENVILENNLRLWPNPVSDILFFESQLNFDKICIVSITGNTLIYHENPMQNTGHLDVSTLKNGIYVAIFYAEGIIQNSIRIIKL